MKLKDLYSLPPMSVSHDLNLAFQAIQDLAKLNTGDTCYKLEQFCNSVEDFIYSIDKNLYSSRFQINMYMEEGDDKYGARLYTVVFDNVPIMMVKNNGRYYDDFNAYLSNEQQLYAFIDYIYSLIKVDENIGKPEVVSEDEDIAELTTVGDYELFDYYDQNNNPKYKKDDLVWAWVLENHLKYNFLDDYQGYVLTKVIIHNVMEFKSINTYHGSQRERGWDNSNKAFGNKMKFFALNNPGVGIGCSLNDKMIIGKVGEIPEPKFAIENFVDSKGFLPKSYKIELETILNTKLEEDNISLQAQ